MIFTTGTNWRAEARGRAARLGAVLSADTRPRILMYHRVFASAHRLAVTPELFRRHLDLLAERGVAVVSVRDLLAMNGHEGRPAVALTFDDGYREMADLVADELVRRSFGATFYVLPRFAGQGHEISPEACFADGGDRFVSHAAIRDMHAAGFEIGAHGLTHRSFTRLDAQQSRDEIAGSRRELEDLLGAPVAGLAYPRGHHADLHKQQAAAAGYAYAVSVRPGAIGTKADPMALPRTEVAGGDDTRILAAKLAGGLDLWHRVAQGARSLEPIIQGRS